MTAGLMGDWEACVGEDNYRCIVCDSRVLCICACVCVLGLFAPDVVCLRQPEMFHVLLWYFFFFLMYFSGFSWRIFPHIHVLFLTRHVFVLVLLGFFFFFSVSQVVF